jgi:hypothetical protein
VQFLSFVSVSPWNLKREKSCACDHAGIRDQITQQIDQRNRATIFVQLPPNPNRHRNGIVYSHPSGENALYITILSAKPLYFTK